jgi:CheY-like chemotaxis protein
VRVLVVDDEPDMRLVTEMMLSSEGHDVLLADDGAAALEMINDHRPDVVLLDIRIPEPDGWVVLRSVKGDPELADVRVVIVSAHSSGETLRRAEDEGSNGYLTKPFSRGELMEAIKLD